jgi:hypothetical protein
MSYVDDNSHLGRTYLERDYSKLEKEIKEHKNDYTYCIEDEKSIYAFNVSDNDSLSRIYGDKFRVIRLILGCVDTLHSEQQEKKCMELFVQINKYMAENPGYYNLRIPTHFVDVVKAYNKEVHDSIFCGGTVEWIGSGKTIPLNQQNDIAVFWADKEYIQNNKKRLLEIAYKSFESYQGQYHISQITESKAGIIYEKWLENSFDNYKDNVVVVAYKDEPIAFVLYGETETAVEAVLGAVDNNYRQYGAYRLMISFGVNYATENHKDFVTSTQFDNFIVQGVWASIGLKPFYSIYNVHLDRR